MQKKYANINLTFEDELKLSQSEVSDFKEVFLVFDRDVNGLLTFPQVCLAVKTLGIRIRGKQYL